MNATPPPPPPPPPDDPFTNQDNGEFDGGSLDTGAPAVAASKGKAMVMMGGIGLIVVYMLYSIFFGGGGDDAPQTAELEPQQVVPKEVEPPPLVPVEEDPPFVPPPQIEPPPVPQAPMLTSIRPEDDSALKAQMQARQRSSMMVVDGGASAFGGGRADSEERANASNDANSQFATAASSKAQKSIATNIGDLRRVIAQGRLIQATLETAINTDLPAPIRAIVSRDVYGEAGTVPLIPIGSRLIGQYNTKLSGGQSRVFVVWNRVIRPDGIDVQLSGSGASSTLVDQIGQAGVAGQVDTKFQYIFSRAVMASIVSIAFAIGSDEISPGDGNSSTTNSTFGTTQSGDAASTATVNALNRLGSLSENFLQQFLDIGPTILVDQGTPVNVFVNRDLIFPAELVGTKIIN